MVLSGQSGGGGGEVSYESKQLEYLQEEINELCMKANLWAIYNAVIEVCTRINNWTITMVIIRVCTRTNHLGYYNGSYYGMYKDQSFGLLQW